MLRTLVATLVVASSIAAFSTANEPLKKVAKPSAKPAVHVTAVKAKATKAQSAHKADCTSDCNGVCPVSAPACDTCPLTNCGG